MPNMDARIDLDEAAQQIVQRRASWVARGLVVGDLTWRDVGEPWPYPLKTERVEVCDPDSVGVRVTKGQQEGSFVLFVGGWADLLYWDGESDQVLDEAPGWDDWMSVEAFGALLDRWAGLFR